MTSKKSGKILEVIVLVNGELKEKILVGNGNGNIIRTKIKNSIGGIKFKNYSHNEFQQLFERKYLNKKVELQYH